MTRLSADFIKIPAVVGGLVATGHNIIEGTERLFTAIGHHSSLWAKTTTFANIKYQDILVTSGSRASTDLKLRWVPEMARMWL